MSLADAERLVLLAEAFTNARAHRMRKELRERIGAALKVPHRSWDSLDCVESADVFVVLKPLGRLTRTNFDQHEPLLRQAIVAACAAFETYLADKATWAVRRLVGNGTTTKRLGEIPLTFEQWRNVEAYQYRKRGITEQVIGPHLRQQASTASSQVGYILSLLGIEQWSNKLDQARKCPKGTTVADLDRITQRRNRIAHEADRLGRRRAPISVAEVQRELEALTSIVDSIEEVLGA